MEKKLLLKSTVFLWKQADAGLLYDWTTAAFFRFSLHDTDIREMCRQWEELDNLYAARFDDENKHIEFQNFIQSIIDLRLGTIHDVNDIVVAFPPVLKINRGVNHANAWKGGMEVQPILPYLSKLRVFLGGSADNHDWWMQTLYPKSSDVYLDSSRFLAFLSQCDQQSLLHLEIIVSDWNGIVLSNYAEALIGFKEKVRFVFAHPNPSFHNSLLDSVIANGYAVTQVCPADPALKKTSWVPGRDYHFLVRSENEYFHWKALLQENGPAQYDFVPIAEDNLDFFRKNVFISEEEILDQKLTKKDIFRHQALNVYQFGVLYVFPDGTIHPAADAPAIGTLEDSVHQIIIRELEENHAWRQTRRLMSPCKDCIYHDLCPSPSVYERILGVPSCTVWQTKD